jgi:hypothetical protein
MKRINPLLTANNPAPIPGCHASVKVIVQSAAAVGSVTRRSEMFEKLATPSALGKHKIQHKFEIKTAVLLNLFCFSFAINRIETPP